MGFATDISGQKIRFELDAATNPDGSGPVIPWEFEILSGNVSDQAHESIFLPVNSTSNTDRVCNAIAYGRVITYNFTGVLLVRNLPWRFLTPTTTVHRIYVGLNRNGTLTNYEYYPEVRHYSRYGVVTSFVHSFDTSTHQTFDVSIIADGSYTNPYTYIQ